MYRQAVFGQQPRPQQFYPGNDQAVFDGTGLSDEDSFGGESSDKRSFDVFDFVSIDVSSPCPPERQTYGTSMLHRHMNTPRLEDYVDDIDDHPESAENIDRTNGSSRWAPTCAYGTRDSSIS